MDVSFGLLVLVIGALAGRLTWLMLSERGQAIQRAQRQQRMVATYPARVGSIYGATRGRYVLLAGSKQVPSVFADTLLMDEAQMASAANALGPILGMEPIGLLRRMRSRWPSRFVYLKRAVSPAVAEAVQALKLRPIGITHEWRREYPSGELASTVVGFRRHDGEPGAGLEYVLEDHLSAEDGKRVLLADARRRPIWDEPGQTYHPRDGGSAFLTLDLVIQRELESAVADAWEQFSADWVAGIVVRPATGEILAMASVPAFNPNQYSKSDPNTWLNRALTLSFEPGSIAKPLYAAAAVQLGVMSYDTIIDCEQGTYRARRGGTIHDAGSHRYGRISLAEVIIHSSNIGMAKVGEALGNRMLYRITRAYGFGEKTGVSLPGEFAGIVRDLDTWTGYSLRRVPFGQEFTVTSLQMAMAFSAIANEGVLMKPMLVERIVDTDGRVVHQAQPTEARRVLSPRVARETVEVLADTVERGTGTKCRLDHWRAFGKTGTAQIAGRGGYNDRDYVGSFIGGAPASDPELVCLISVYRPDYSKGHYGGTVAAPFVRRVLERSLAYLQVPSDRERGQPVSPDRVARSSDRGAR